MDGLLSALADGMEGAAGYVRQIATWVYMQDATAKEIYTYFAIVALWGLVAAVWRGFRRRSHIRPEADVRRDAYYNGYMAAVRDLIQGHPVEVIADSQTKALAETKGGE